MGGGMGGGMNDFMGAFMKDPELMQAMQDPEIAAALMDLKSNPGNIAKYMGNPKIMNIFMKLQGAMGGGMPGGMPDMGGMGGMGGMPDMGGGMPAPPPGMDD